MNLPCCFFPTQTILLDDNTPFLESMKLSLGKDRILVSFNTPNDAIDYITQAISIPFTRHCLQRPEELKKNHRLIDVDIDAIQKEIYNPKRFMENTVIVIDYAMPSMHGLDVCKELRHLPIKKIMLTGEADDKIAVQAFNQGLIHKFIRKGGPSSVVASAIIELQKKYFVDQSTIIIDSLTRNMDYPPSCLDDPVFMQFFNDFCDKQTYAEFYLLDAMGSFLFLDGEGNPTFLMVKDEEGMQESFEMAELSDKSVPETLLSALKNKEKLLYFFDKETQKTDPSTWDKYAHSVTKLCGKDNYYYAVTNDPDLYQINKHQILPYSEYLRSL